MLLSNNKVVRIPDPDISNSLHIYLALSILLNEMRQFSPSAFFVSDINDQNSLRNFILSLILLHMERIEPYSALIVIALKLIVVLLVDIYVTESLI